MTAMAATKRTLEAADARPCFLLERCPPEIRNVIYEYALMREGGGVILKSSGLDCKLGRHCRQRGRCYHGAPPRRRHHHENYGACPRRDYPSPAKQPKKTSFRDVDQIFALSYTCKKLHNECAALPYQYNEVRFVLDIEESSGPIRSKSPPHRELRRIAKRQAEQGELKQGLVIDIGCIQGGPHDRLNPFHTFMQKNQRELRGLHKGTRSLTLAFDIGGVALRSTTGHKMDSYKSISCEIELRNPESIGVQFMRQLASEMSFVGKPEDVRAATARLTRIFWPVYAVRNGIQ